MFRVAGEFYPFLKQMTICQTRPLVNLLTLEGKLEMLGLDTEASVEYPDVAEYFPMLSWL